MTEVSPREHTVFKLGRESVARRAVENSSRFTKVDGDFSVENTENWCYVVGE